MDYNSLLRAAIDKLKQGAIDVASGALEPGRQMLDIPRALQAYYGHDKNFKPLPTSPSAERGLDFINGALIGGNPEMGALEGNGGYIARQALDKSGEVAEKVAQRAIESAHAQPGGLQAGGVKLDDLAPLAEKIKGNDATAGLSDTGTLYHGTSKEAAARIKAAGGFTPETAKGLKDLTGFDFPADRPVSLTLDKKTAELYSGTRPEGGTGELLAFRGDNLKLATETDIKKLGLDQYGDNKTFIDGLKKAGYDGYHTSSPHDEKVETVVFNKGKLKLLNNPRVAQQPGGVEKFQGLPDLSTKVIERMRGMREVSPETITNLAKSPDVKQAERDLLNQVLTKYVKPQDANAGLSDTTFYRGEGGSHKFQGKTDFVKGRNFATDPELAKEFGKVSEYTLKPNAKVLELDAQGKNLDQIAKEIGVTPSEMMSTERLREALRKKGYDAIKTTQRRVDENGRISEKSKVVTNLVELTDDALIPKSRVAQQPVSDTPQVDLRNVAQKIPVQQFAEDVQKELLPLEIQDRITYPSGGSSNIGFYYRRSLPPDLQGNVADYGERLFNSPVKTSAGGVHFGDLTDNYFGHTRVEDLEKGGLPISNNDMLNMTGDQISNYYKAQRAPGDTRRVLELQSDLFQKGRLDKELNSAKHRVNMSYQSAFNLNPKEMQDRFDSLQKLKPYENTWHERLIREEVKKAAEDGKTKLQFPVGDTAMKIEGLGQNADRWYDFEGGEIGGQLRPEALRVGQSVWDGYDGQVITDVLGNGKFKAVNDLAAQNDSDLYEYLKGKGWLDDGLAPTVTDLVGAHGDDKQIMKYLSKLSEEFDISDEVDTNNPIYKFYESEVGKYLKNKYGAQRVRDAQGVEWWEVPIKPEHAKAPVEAFGIGAAIPALMQRDEDHSRNSATLKQAVKQLPY